MEKVKQIYCVDKDFCPLIAKQNTQSKWELLRLTHDFETEEAKYECHVFSESREYDHVDDVEVTNTTNGRTLIKVLQDGEWHEIVLIQLPKMAAEDEEVAVHEFVLSNPAGIKYLCFDEEGESLESLLERGAGIKTVLIDLTDAVSYTDDEKNSENVLSIMDYFLKNGIDVNEKDEWGNTALINACSMWYGVDIVRLLLKYGANVNEKTKDGRTALMNACDGHINTVKLLLEHGANVHEQDKWGGTALNWACDASNVDAVKLLLGHGADANGFKYTFFYGVEWEWKEQIEILKLLSDKNIDVNTTDKDGMTTFMHIAAEKWSYYKGDLEEFEVFFKNQKELLNLLLHHGADINATSNDGKTALHHANDYMHMHIHYDIRKKHPLLITKWLVEKGANVHATDNDGWTALMYATDAKLKLVADYLKKMNKK